MKVGAGRWKSRYFQRKNTKLFFNQTKVKEFIFNSITDFEAETELQT